MKKNLFLIVFSAILVLGCSLDRTPLSGPSTGNFPANEKEAQAGLLAAYKKLGGNIQYREPFPARWLDNLTDDAAMRTVLSKWPDYTLSTITPTYAAVKDTYAYIYSAAGRIHLVLDNLDKIKDDLGEDTYSQIKAELLCMRAYLYDFGCQMYGDIPFIDHALNLEDFAYARTPKEDVINRILTDMDDDLIEHLPVVWPAAQWGTSRLGRVAAYGLKARICLNWGRFEEAAKYSAKALSLADGIFDLTPLDCTYYPTHADGEPDPTPLFGFAAETQSKEWIWSLPYSKLIAYTHHGIYPFVSRVHNGASVTGPSLHMMCTFQCTDGLPITESPLFNWTDPWRNRDPRLELYTVRHNSRTMGVQFSIDPADKNVYDYNSKTFVNNFDVNGNKSEYGPNGKQGPGGFLWRKYIDPAYYGQITDGNYEDEMDVPIMRLAELLLIDAEANIEWGGGDKARAAAELTRIRARVKMPPITTMDPAELRSALRYERKVELCNEGFRWFDIRRWKSAEDPGQIVAVKAINGPQYAPDYGKVYSNAKPTIDKDWVVTFDGVSTFDGKPFDARVHTVRKFVIGKDELWPIPQDEIDANPLINPEDNNPGY